MYMNKKYFWKVWLHPNLLTKNVDNDLIAEVSTNGKTLHNADLAQFFIDEGSEIKYDTILSILNTRDRIVRTKLQECFQVQDGVCHFKPRVPGVWIGANAKFDPEVNKPGLDIIETAETREALAQVGVQVLGVRESGAFIGLVTDAATGLTDGTITPGDDIIIQGDKIKIAPDGEDNLGVFYRNEELSEIYHTTHRLTQNDPKKVIARVPQMPPGRYTLWIVTRFTNSASYLENARTITYEQPLLVV
jgi:hypothetical protein